MINHDVTDRELESLCIAILDVVHEDVMLEHINFDTIRTFVNQRPDFFPAVADANNMDAVIRAIPSKDLPIFLGKLMVRVANEGVSRE